MKVRLRDFVAFIAAGNILLKYVVGGGGGGGVARAWTSYFATFESIPLRVCAYMLLVFQKTTVISIL